MYIDELKIIYDEIKPQIQNRLEEFRQTWKNSDDKGIFIELAFCVLTPHTFYQLPLYSCVPLPDVSTSGY